MSSLEEQLLNLYDCSKLKFSNYSSKNMSWCIDEPTTFISSYQHLNSFGPNKLIQFANKHIYGVNYFLKSKFIHHVKLTIKDKYFDPIHLMGFSLNKSLVTQFYSTFFFIHSKYWKTFRNWSFSEYFSFLQHSCLILFENLSLPNDLYKTEKKIQNEQFEKYYLIVKEAFFDQNLSFSYLCYLLIRSNWVDSYEKSTKPFLINFSKEINEILDNEPWVNEFIKSLDVFNFYALHNAIKGKPATFLYECDNNGEIYIDLILIEYILKQNHTVYISTKSNPVLNDIIISDLKLLFDRPVLSHLKKYIKTSKLHIINNGSQDVISLRYDMSEAYKRSYSQSDYVILKGQGNFESYPVINTSLAKKPLIKYKAKHFYLFGLKSSFTKSSLHTLGLKLPIQSLILAQNYDFTGK